MSTFRHQLFYQFATSGIATSVNNFKAEYQPKKENRFTIDTITYEVGPTRLREDGIELEISSKVPQDELTDRDDYASYFTAIKERLASDTKQPEDIDMENIVRHEVDGEESKERDYVRLFYRYTFAEMGSNEAVAAEIARIERDSDAAALPEVPNVNTLAGRVVLRCVENYMQAEAMERMRRLIDANQSVRQAFSNS